LTFLASLIAIRHVYIITHFLNNLQSVKNYNQGVNDHILPFLTSLQDFSGLSESIRARLTQAAILLPLIVVTCESIQKQSGR